MSADCCDTDTHHDDSTERPWRLWQVRELQLAATAGLPTRCNGCWCPVPASASWSSKKGRGFPRKNTGRCASANPFVISGATEA